MSVTALGNVDFDDGSIDHIRETGIERQNYFSTA